MKRSAFIICAAFGFLLGSQPIAFSQASSAGSKLQVRVKYSGSGTVDETHKIYIVLWDSPDFVSSQMMPLATQAVTSKNGTATFTDVTKTPVYVSAAYDPSGQWEAQSPPPDGTSLGLYSKTPGKPEPVNLKPGKNAQIELSFDDSVKLKDGKPAVQ